VEDRLTGPAGGARRPGWALIALAAILVITAAWWALALLPASAEPEWLTRTRAACFGSERGGLPDTSGWILLIGEPIGMLGVLLAIGGRSLGRDIAWLMARPVRRTVVIGAAAAVVVATAALGVRVARSWEGGRKLDALDSGALRRVDRDGPASALVDQHGRRASLAELGGPAIVTFAFGHCATVCPVIVNDLRAARGRAGRDDVPLVVVTLDPWRDTPERLPTLAASWHLAPHDRALSGGIAEVNAALDALGIARRRNERTGDVDHATTLFIVGRDGQIEWRGDGGVAGVEAILERL
jgi:cytochrome oxidase Cu insertion factor (SCO1/SenC/PrrC family)